MSKPPTHPAGVKTPEIRNGVSAFYAKDAAEWRQWLLTNGETEKTVWLILYKKESGVPSVHYSEAVDEALCFGWIDSKPNKRDDKSYYQFFARRHPKSNWSGVNKNKVERLTREGRMQQAGLDAVALAKQTGTWTALEAVESLTLPPALAKAFVKNKKAAANFSAFPKSVRRGILEWINSAKRAETQEKRIAETVSQAEKNIRANQYRQ